MNLSCAVIGDLLPLYVEGLTSEESAALVREHLESCADCRERLEALQRPVEPAAAGPAPIQDLKKELRRRRLRTAAMAALMVFTVLFALLARAIDEKPVPCSDDLLRVEGPVDADSVPGPLDEVLQPEGWQTSCPGKALVIKRNRYVTRVATACDLDEETGELTVYMQYFLSRAAGMADSAEGEPPMVLFDGDAARDVLFPVPDRVIYGFGSEKTLLWGEPMDGGMEVLPRLALAYYTLIAAGLTAGLGLAWLACRKKKSGALLGRLCLAPASYLLGQLLVKGTETASEFLSRDLGMICIEALAVYGLLTLVLAARRSDR